VINIKQKPEPICGRIKCEIWRECVHGANCMLSDFNYSGEKRMPFIIIKNGMPMCQDIKRG